MYSELEKTVLDTILEIEEDGIFQYTVDDINYYSGINTNILRGVISSLIKKEAIYVADDKSISLLKEK